MWGMFVELNIAYMLHDCDKSVEREKQGRKRTGCALNDCRNSCEIKTKYNHLTVTINSIAETF
jgi:hypothetical protein